ncbi:MAG: alpha/beta hydrolase [Pseudomonadaceae bacterium]|nr:alpha/beta hydrolase [Pseudomonadaceae bacterium]
MSEWFDFCINTPSETGNVTVKGARIHYVTWGDVGKPGLLFVHGSRAHLEWFRFTAPFLADQFRIAALDLSGNGLSDWRERYDRETFAEEVMAVAKAAELGEKPYIVGHSFGGFVTLEAAHHYGAELGGVIFGDFSVAKTSEYEEWGLHVERHGEPARETRVYQTFEEALGRFRFVPEQPVEDERMLTHVGTAGLREVDGGWTWRFDPGMYDYLEMGPEQEAKFAGLECRSAVILGEKSEDEAAFYGEHMRAMTGGYLPIFTIPNAHHHYMFEYPLAFAMTIKGILLAWHAERHADELKAALALAAKSIP